ncbi:MAG: hypothetical protein J7501_13245 [Bdellovibrio sp.]|nr:hypothetical protein [Bdellovibrio sp.]
MRILIATLTLMSCVSNAAPKMGRESGGGTSVSAGFVHIGKTALLLLSNDNILSSSDVDEAIKNTSVFDVESICSQDPNTGAVTCLDAQYQANLNKIEFDRNKWRQKSCEARFAIAAHEYLRAAGLEDSNYNYSNLFYGGGPSGKYSREMTAVCNNIESSANSTKDLNCQQSVKYLELALREHDSDRCDDIQSKNRYIVIAQNIFGSWIRNYGSSCLSDGKETCMAVCFPKVKSSCFDICRSIN